VTPSTPHSSVAATAPFIEAERLVEALPLAGKRGEWDHRARLATIHALLAIAASLLEPAPSPRTPPTPSGPGTRTLLAVQPNASWLLHRPHVDNARSVASTAADLG